jgi:hypothetical protein
VSGTRHENTDETVASKNTISLGMIQDIMGNVKDLFFFFFLEMLCHTRAGSIGIKRTGVP